MSAITSYICDTITDCYVLFDFIAMLYCHSKRQLPVGNKACPLGVPSQGGSS